MRTTIEIPAALRQKLVNEAVNRQMRGYSEIIREALEQYFTREEKNNLSGLRSLRGVISHEEYLDSMEMLAEGRKNWKM